MGGNDADLPLGGHTGKGAESALVGHPISHPIHQPDPRDFGSDLNRRGIRGKGVDLATGPILLCSIFYPLLGFGQAQYSGSGASMQHGFA